MATVTGIEAFRDAMAAHVDKYVLIGGGACSLLFNARGDNFRTTKDLDIVVLIDRHDAEFARDFWTFIHSGGYKAWRRKEENHAHYYRFELPKDSPHAFNLPSQIELFARHPDFELADSVSEITPLPFDEDVSSLSAIILDDGYYELIRSNVSTNQGVPLLEPLHIIPLKMRAHIDLNAKHKAGHHVKEKDLTKHRTDVSNLARLLDPADSLPLKGHMHDDAEAFLADFEQYIGNQTSLKLRKQLEESLSLLRRVYLQ